MDFLNMCLRSRNFFLSAGLPDSRCFWKVVSLCLAIRLSFWLTQWRVVLKGWICVCERSKSRVKVRPIAVLHWGRSIFHFQAWPGGRLLVHASSHPILSSCIGIWTVVSEKNFCRGIELDLNNVMITYTRKDTNSLRKSRICCKEEIKNIAITSLYGDSLSKIWVI